MSTIVAGTSRSFTLVVFCVCCLVLFARSNRASAADRLVTVGPGGDYATLNEALTVASGTLPDYASEGEQIEVRLLSGFVLQEQILVARINLGFVTITANLSPVPIRRSALTQGVFANAAYPAFSAFENATLPTIDVLFRMDGTGAASGRSCFWYSHNSRGVIKPGAGCTHAGYRGLEVHNGSHVHASGTIFTDAGAIGIRLANGGVVNVHGAEASRAGSTCITAHGGCVLNGEGLKATGCGSYGVDVKNDSRANLRGAEISANEKGVAVQNAFAQLAYATLTVGPRGTGIVARQGGRVNATGALVTRRAHNSIHASDGSFINALGSTLHGALDVGCVAENGSRVNLHKANCTHAAAGSDAIEVRVGSFINATAAVGEIAGPANTLTDEGVIFR